MYYLKKMVRIHKEVVNAKGVVKSEEIVKREKQIKEEIVRDVKQEDVNIILNNIYVSIIKKSELRDFSGRNIVRNKINRVFSNNNILGAALIELLYGTGILVF